MTQSSEQDLVVCPHCAERNAEGEHLCRRCGTALTSYGVSSPMGQVYATGDTYRKAIANPTKLIVLIGMWLIVGPAAIAFSVSLGWTLAWPFMEGFRSVGEFFQFLFSLGLFGAGAAIFDTMLFRVSWNYFRRARVRGREFDD